MLTYPVVLGDSSLNLDNLSRLVGLQDVPLASGRAVHDRIALAALRRAKRARGAEEEETPKDIGIKTIRTIVTDRILRRESVRSKSAARCVRSS